MDAVSIGTQGILAFLFSAYFPSIGEKLKNTFWGNSTKKLIIIGVIFAAALAFGIDYGLFYTGLAAQTTEPSVLLAFAFAAAKGSDIVYHNKKDKIKEI